jgi:chloramphenicol O-acetyltransferase type A
MRGHGAEDSTASIMFSYSQQRDNLCLMAEQLPTRAKAVRPGEQVLDLATWSRRAHFDFFRAFDNPYFNITADVDVTVLHERCRSQDGLSFAVAAYYLSLRAINAIEPFGYRIRRQQTSGVQKTGEPLVIRHTIVHGGSIVLRPDESFGFVYFDYREDYAAFAADAAEALAAGLTSDRFEPRDDRDDLIHYSVIPWVSFTSFSHARRWGTDDAVPKLVFGKHRKVGGRRLMPVSVEVHHALVDGLHVGRFFQHFQAHLDDRTSLTG